MFGKIWLTILVLALLIFVHELGHFLVAKLFRVKVLRFSLGFGSRLVGFRWGETEYQLSALPLGGYVKMAGDDPTEEASEVAPEDRGRGFLEQPPWKRALIALAGPAMNLAFPILIYFVVFYFQSTDLSSRLGQVEPDRPAWAAGLRQGDRITAVDGTPVRYFGELAELIGPHWEQPVRITFERLGEVRTVEVVPEKMESPSAFETEIRGIIGVRPMASAPIVGVAARSTPAGRAGLRSFDRVTEVDGVKVTTYSELEARLVQLLRSHQPIALKVVRDAPAGGAAGALTTYRVFEVELRPGEAEDLAALGLGPTDLYVFEVERGSPADQAGLRRGDRLLEAGGIRLGGWATLERVRRKADTAPMTIAFARNGERLERTVEQRKVVRKDEFDNLQPMELLFGVAHDVRPTSFAEGEPIPYRIGPGTALLKALRLVPDNVREIVLALRGLVEGRLSFKSMGGPVMMGDIASRAAEQGWDSFLRVLALISVNLGVMNLLPVPILDGFHILSAAFEGIRRRPIGLRARLIANYIGLVLLLTLMAFVLKNEFMRYIRPLFG
jgi:regulator of sigma E protease